MKSYKQLIGEIITSKPITRIIKLFYKLDIYKFGTYSIDLTVTEDFIKGSIFWGLYERSEIKMIEKYMLKDYSVIELGASLGITSLAINKILINKKIVSIEANRKLITNLENTKLMNHLGNWTILNYAIDYSGASHVKFTVDPANLGSHKSHDYETTNIIEVPTITLKVINKKWLNTEKFILIADIEGAEIEFVLNDQIFLKNYCQQMILELHDTQYRGTFYSKSQIASLIKTECKMNEVFNDGKTWVFNK